MKKITPAHILKSLQTLEPRVTIPKDIMERARGPIERMVNMGRGD
jgi:quinolinate synthase